MNKKQLILICHASSTLSMTDTQLIKNTYLNLNIIKGAAN